MILSKNISSLTIIIIAAALLAPLLFMFAQISNNSSETIAHLSQTVLPLYVSNTIYLIVGVGLATFLIGTVTAYLTANYQFFASRFMSFALFLPLAIPAYIAAFIYGGIFEFHLNIRSIGGAIFVMSFVFYPYVYMLSHVAFAKNRNLINLSHLYGLSPCQTFFKTALPSARPAIAAGISLALMETIADFGTVQHFAVDTFTTGIYRSWYGMFDKQAAIQLAFYLMLFVVIFIILEKYSQKQNRYRSVNINSGFTGKIKLKGAKSFAAFIICAIPFFFGFILPVTQMIIWTAESSQGSFDSSFISSVKNSFSVSFAAAAIAVIIALIYSYILRFGKKTSITNLMIRISAQGYAIPGSVVAVAIVAYLGYVDNFLDKKFDTGLLFSGTIIALIFAYLLRFLTVSLNSVESSMQKITDEIHFSAKLFGLTNRKIIHKIHSPIISRSVILALLFVFVEAIKELPATLIIRPFNFETLATRAYQLASDERLIDSATYGLSIVILGLIPVLLLGLGSRNK